jgi:hypothetical protein
MIRCWNCSTELETPVSSAENRRQPIDLSPAWWDGNVAIPLTHEQWRYIRDVLRDDLIYHYGLISEEAKTMANNIIDCIDENLGVKE